MSERCVICNSPALDGFKVEPYEKEHQGKMVPICSDACEEALYDWIGESFEEKRRLAGIEKWEEEQKIEFKPLLESGRGKAIEAYIIPELPKFCVHQLPFECYPLSKKWAVSHIESGRDLVIGDTKDEAVHAAIEMLKDKKEGWVEGELAKWKKAEEIEALKKKIIARVRCQDFETLQQIMAIIDGGGR